MVWKQIQPTYKEFQICLTHKKEVLSLLDFLTTLQDSKLADIAQSLRGLTLKNAKFVWSKQHDTCFKKIKQLVSAHPVLKYYDGE